MSKRTKEAFSRVKVDALLVDAGWKPLDGVSVIFEQRLSDGTQADYVLCDRRGRPVAVIEAKRASIDPISAQDQALHYAGQLGVNLVFLSNGDEVWFMDADRDAHARQVAGIFAQEDLERRAAVRTMRRDLAAVPTDRAIAGRDYQLACIDALCREIALSRRKLLVEMATGTGKTRTAAAFIKRLFEAGEVTRVLFLVDRITLATQAEDAFTEHLAEYPSYILRSSRGIDHAKRVTIATLQTMINEYAAFSAGYFDLVIIDECHRSIYGQWSGVLKHFDGIQLGLTATPCMVAEADLPDPEDGAAVRDTLRFFELEAPTYRYTLRQAIDEGHLVPYWIYKAKTVKTASVDGFEVRRGELDWSDMDESTRAELEALFDGSEVITVDPRSLERRFTIPERNRAMVREFRDVMERGFKGSDGVQRYPLKGKTIVFAVTKKHAETLATMFDSHFADLKPHPTTRYADFVVSDVGGGPAPDAAALIKRFKNETFPQILVSVNMLDTGFDCPEVVNLVMARFTGSTILYRQMRGRGTRPAPHIRKSHFTMFDFTGVTELHDDEDAENEGGRVTGGTTQPPSQPTRLLTIDVDDHIDPLSRDWVTLDDDGRIIRTAAHEARAAALGLRFEAWLARQDFDAEQTRWVRRIEALIKADAEDVTGFWHDDFDDPRIGGYARARAVFGGEDALDALIASLNDAVFGGGASDARPDDRPIMH